MTSECKGYFVPDPPGSGEMSWRCACGIGGRFACPRFLRDQEAEKKAEAAKERAAVEGRVYEGRMWHAKGGNPVELRRDPAVPVVRPEGTVLAEPASNIDRLLGYLEGQRAELYDLKRRV